MEGIDEKAKEIHGRLRFYWGSITKLSERRGVSPMTIHRHLLGGGTKVSDESRLRTMMEAMTLLDELDKARAARLKKVFGDSKHLIGKTQNQSNG